MFSGMKIVRIPLCSHTGILCQPLVSVGDTVTVGQMIGNTEKGLSCPVHASVSGKVIAIEEKTDLLGATVSQVVIENDGQDTLHASVKPFEKSLSDTSAEEVIAVIRQAGIAGMNGTSLPVYAYMESVIGKVDKLIINGAESEPFLCADHRLMLEYPAAVINGVKVLLKALGVRTAYIAVENNKLDAINKLESLLAGSQMISVRMLKTKYPQGDARQLVAAVTGKEVPAEKTPEDVGCAVFQTSVCAAIFHAFANGMPLVRRIVTVDGDCVGEAKNVSVPIGTMVSDLLAFCGGLKRTPARIVAGGPMRGRAIADMDTPVTQEIPAVLCFSSGYESVTENSGPCIRCGRCVQVCPMHLMPNYLSQFAQEHARERAKQFGVMNCSECRLCSYVCPGRRDNSQMIRMLKEEIRKSEL